MALAMVVGLGKCRIVLDDVPSPVPQKGAEAPNFRLISIVAKWLDVSR